MTGYTVGNVHWGWGGGRFRRKEALRGLWSSFCRLGSVPGAKPPETWGGGKQDISGTPTPLEGPVSGPYSIAHGSEIIGEN